MMGLSEKQDDEIKLIEKSQKQQVDLITAENDKILSATLHEQISSETQKLETIFKSALQSQQRQHEETLAIMKSNMKKETSALEEQLRSQNEMKQVLDRVQKRTVEISEVVASSLKQREDELRRKEIEMARAEREIIEDEQVQLDIEEKRV
jgi:hypothetical protein